jgi:gentisate 1,2-dioxygenase
MAEQGGNQRQVQSPLVAALEAADIHPLWDRYKKITPILPKARDAPFLWRWRDIEPFTSRAATEIAVEDVERRALIMANPAFGGETATTGNLIGAFTVLEPGDRARPHRHTAAAIRFATRCAGAVTIVNGRRCAMQAGDLILTPPMCWHGHINESDHRTIWFDAANIPLICNLDANFFEPGEHGANDFWQVDEGEERLWTEPGLAADGISHGASHSPKYRYAGESTRRMLAAVTPGPDGARIARYVNPATGGSVMTTLECAAMRLTRGVTTRPKRATYNMICLVVSGAGRSTIGEHSFDWSQHDVFTIPHWSWASHAALEGDADLFLVSDKAALARLDLVREEMQ